MIFSPKKKKKKKKKRKQKNKNPMSFTQKTFEENFFFRLKAHRNFTLGVLKCDDLPMA